MSVSNEFGAHWVRFSLGVESGRDWLGLRGRFRVSSQVVENQFGISLGVNLLQIFVSCVKHSSSENKHVYASSSIFL